MTSFVPKPEKQEPLGNFLLTVDESDDHIYENLNKVCGFFLGSLQLESNNNKVLNKKNKRESFSFKCLLDPNIIIKTSKTIKKKSEAENKNE